MPVPKRSSANKKQTVVLVPGKGSFVRVHKELLRGLGIASLLGVLLFILLNFSGVLPLSSFFGLGGGGLKTGVLTPEAGFSCPVAGNLCKEEGKQVLWNGNPALSYSLPAGTFVYSISLVNDSKEFSTDPFEKTNKYRGIWQAMQIGDDCYTATYVFPYEALIRRFRLPLEKGEEIANVPPADIDLQGEKVNMIMQLQKRELVQDQNALQSTLVSGCDIGDRQPDQFGTYQILDPSVFGELKAQ